MRKLYLALVGFATLTLLAGVNYWIASRHPGVSVPTAITSCIPCHIRVKSETDGIAASRFSKGSHPVNAAKIRPEKLSLDARDCGKCHQFEYTTWHESVHARAFTNHIFAHAVQRDREAWCLNCHTPLWSGNQADVERIIGWLAKGGIARTQMPAFIEQGITCAVCHIRDGKIIGSGKKSRDPTGKKHEVTVDKNLRTEKFCAGCHQFSFPAEVKPVVVYQHEPAMQNVVAEHLSLRKLYSDKRCGDCHYKGADHSLHQTTGEDMREKFQIRVKRRIHKPGEITYTLRTPPIGHHYPTGDLFRAVRLTLFDKQGNELYREEFRKEVRVVDQQLISDTTLRSAKVGESASVTKTLTLSAEAARCELNYHLQANIEPTLEKEGSLKPFIRKLADCRIE
ncbi:MAG: hypothetical protein JNJ69_12480 [Leptospiraceae bacterium]|nr:hypothetical protein [Leptospiraceae bacterium]